MVYAHRTNELLIRSFCNQSVFDLRSEKPLTGLSQRMNAPNRNG